MGFLFIFQQKILTSREGLKINSPAVSAGGYIPVNESVVTSSEYKNNKSTKLPAKLEDSMKHLYSVPVSKNSNAAYQQLNSIMQNILSAAQKGQNVNSQINAGKQKFDAAWKQ